MQTCRLARLCALEAWRKDVEKQPEDGTFGVYGFLGLEVEQTWHTASKIDELIE